MDSFEGRLAVVTGGGTGMGRELCRQLSAQGCHVAMCDVSAENMDDTRVLCLEGAPAGTRVTTFVADVSDEAAVGAFRDAVLREHETDHIDLLFNNAGIGGGGSLIHSPREEWDRTFGVCWGGVYNCTRAFLPALIASSDSHLVNTSSVNGFWASLGPTTPHTAYSAAKFAVKGFSEALLTDLRLNAPHVKVSVVMPGHIGTSIVINSMKYFGRDPKEITHDQLLQVREDWGRQGVDFSSASDEDMRNMMQLMGESFRDAAPMSAAQAATRILDGVRAGEWRILVGADAVKLDALVRESPESAYSPAFYDALLAGGVFGALNDAVSG